MAWPLASDGGFVLAAGGKEVVVGLLGRCAAFVRIGKDSASQR